MSSYCKGIIVSKNYMSSVPVAYNRRGSHLDLINKGIRLSSKNEKSIDSGSNYWHKESLIRDSGLCMYD